MSIGGLPYSPEPHGIFMAHAYAESPALGQLAVSYILAYYRTEKGGFRGGPPGELTVTQESDWNHVCAEKDIGDLWTADDSLTTRGQAKQRLAGLYGALDVTSHTAAVRLAYEEERETVEVAPGELNVSPLSLATVDLWTRGVRHSQISRLTGDAPNTCRIRRVPEVLDALHMRSMSPGEAQNMSQLARWARVVKRLYELSIFTPGLALQRNLHAEHSGVVMRFDKAFGRGVPFKHLPGAPRYLPRKTAES